MFPQNVSCGKQRKARNKETLNRFFNDGAGDVFIYILLRIVPKGG